VPSKGGDGPKWACALDTLNSSALVYSFGSNGNTDFEEGVRERVHTPHIYIFDPSTHPSLPVFLHPSLVVFIYPSLLVFLHSSLSSFLPSACLLVC
jgi:hypothetical protein